MRSLCGPALRQRLHSEPHSGAAEHDRITPGRAGLDPAPPDRHRTGAPWARPARAGSPVLARLNAAPADPALPSRAAYGRAPAGRRLRAVPRGRPVASGARAPSSRAAAMPSDVRPAPMPGSALRPTARYARFTSGSLPRPRRKTPCFAPGRGCPRAGGAWGGGRCPPSVTGRWGALNRLGAIFTAGSPRPGKPPLGRRPSGGLARRRQAPNLGPGTACQRLAGRSGFGSKPYAQARAACGALTVE